MKGHFLALAISIHLYIGTLDNTVSTSHEKSILGLCDWAVHFRKTRTAFASRHRLFHSVVTLIVMRKFLSVLKLFGNWGCNEYMLRKVSTNSSLSRLGLFHFGKAMFDLLLHLWLACRFGVARFCNITACIARGHHIHFGRVFFSISFFSTAFQS